MSVAFSPDGSQLASGSLDSSIWLWDATLGVATAIQVLRGNPGLFHSIAFSPDGSQLAGSDASSIRLWDTTSDGLRLASGSDDHSIWLWDAMSGEAIAIIQGHTAGVNSIAFSPDGLQLASTSFDRSVRLWDTTSGTSLAILEGHTIAPLLLYFHQMVCDWPQALGTIPFGSVAFSPDSLQLASSSCQSVRLWDAIVGTCIAILPCYDAFGIHAITFSADAQTLIVKTIPRLSLWDLTSQPPCRREDDDYIWQSLFINMFGDPRKNNESYRWERL
ncbi:hypothetical protein BS47DRAFT_1388140 [Hydnum rufescens UP504]|uniref:WD40 repeat-like protein n=1 Tax=Hydnum rufescens UP504 TaxID=1448309 RepID=A0A9P6DYA5_9AGAM|nr:hypothetical protein BS47DRAFT_1388140 [Hydnum rufescens UP504]